MNRNELISLSASVVDVVSNKIEKKFSQPKQKENKELAKRCLFLCREWTLSREDFTDNYRMEKGLCKKYVKENLVKQTPYGNLLLNALFSVLVKLIIEWIVENYIRNLIAK